MKYSEFEPIDISRGTNQQLALVNDSFEGKVPEVWRDMAELNFVAMRCHASLGSITDSSLVEMAVMLVYQLSSTLGGCNVYIPNGLISVRGEKSAIIAKEYTGHNLRQLARKHKVSEMRIRQIIQDQANQAKGKKLTP
ncbi:MAG: Mor transcription activator family protein [Pseudomonadota bacterium]